MDKKLYVITRKDLPKSQQAVQAGHALAEFLLTEDRGEWENGTLVYLAVQGEPELQCTSHNLTSSGIQHALFREPDIGNQMTAIACLGSNEVVEEMPLL
jgi:hypothetical protein